MVFLRFCVIVWDLYGYGFAAGYVLSLNRVLIVMQIMALVGQFLVFTGFLLGHGF